MAPETPPPPRPAPDPRRAPAYQAEADAALKNGDFAAAQPALRDLLVAQQSLYGSDHPQLVPALRSLARAQEKLGALTEAENTAGTSLRINELTPIERSADIAADLMRLASLSLHHRPGPATETWLTRALKINRIVHGDFHADTAKAWTLWGDYYFTVGKWAASDELYEKAAEVWRRVPEAAAAEALDTDARRARLSDRRGDRIGAERRWQEVLRRREQRHGAADPRVADDLIGLGRFYSAANLFRKSLPLLGRALEIRGKHAGAAHPDTADALAAGAEALGLEGRVGEAEDHYLRAVKIYESTCGAMSPDLAGCLNDLAGLYYDHDHFREAEPLLRRALGIVEAVFGADHAMMRTGRSNLMLCLREMKRNAEADVLARQLNAPAA